MNIKYTSDGRKVLVVGKLNSEQHIVQEIFISNGQEVPSGENFVVSSLHDAPMESWKEKDLRELEERYDKTRKSIERRINEANNRLSVAETKSKERASAMLSFAKNADSEQLQTLHAFMAGEITHFFIDNYSPAIVTWESNEPYDTDSWGGRLKIDGLKLISLFGRYDGRLDYQINQYRDGSGSSTRIIPCTSYEEALAEAQSIVDAEAELYVSGEHSRFSPDRWSSIDGIQIPAGANKKYADKKRKGQIARIEKLRGELTNLEAECADEDREEQK